MANEINDHKTQENEDLIAVTADPFDEEFDPEIADQQISDHEHDELEEALSSVPDEAVGISYHEGENPIISALGSKERAQAIIALAQERGVYIHKDKVLLDELKKLKEGDQIPKELFGIIAAILSFSYLLQGKTPESWVRSDGTTSINTSI